MYGKIYRSWLENTLQSITTGTRIDGTNGAILNRMKCADSTRSMGGKYRDDSVCDLRFYTFDQ